MRRWIVATVTALLLCVGIEAASPPKTPKAQSPKAQPTAAGKFTTQPETNPVKAIAKADKRKKVQIGSASWYGKAFHGRMTASGEPYDMFQFTVAHKELPLGTWIKVTNLRNGKWVIARVNDRGPYVGDRIVDVSYSIAQMLNFRGSGVQRVRVEVISAPATVAVAANEGMFGGTF